MSRQKSIFAGPSTLRPCPKPTGRPKLPLCLFLPCLLLAPTHPHLEGHFESSATLRDIVIGLSDGLTVPFALAAGLSGAVASSRIVVLAGLAEIAAGSIAMGLGGYLAARGDAEHYASEKKREQREIVERTHDEEEEIYEIFEQYSVPRASAAPVLEALKQNPAAWVEFMMRFELGLKEPTPNRAHRSALTIALSYIAGGLVPLLPYMLVTQNQTAPSSSPSWYAGGTRQSSEPSKEESSAPAGSAAPLQTVLIGGTRPLSAAYLLSTPAQPARLKKLIRTQLAPVFKPPGEKSNKTRSGPIP